MTREKYAYCLPSKMAKKMKEVSIRSQLEASIFSMFLLIIGMTLFGIYAVIYFQQTWYFKGLLIFNTLCGIVLMGSFLITTYQQYVNYMETMGIDPDAEKAAIKARGNIFKRVILAFRERKANKKLQEMIKDGEN